MNACINTHKYSLPFSIRASERPGLFTLFLDSFKVAKKFLFATSSENSTVAKYFLFSPLSATLFQLPIDIKV